MLTINHVKQLLQASYTKVDRVMSLDYTAYQSFDGTMKKGIVSVFVSVFVRACVFVSVFVRVSVLVCVFQKI